MNINQIKIIGQRPSFFMKWRLKSAVQIVYLSQLKDVTQSKKIHPFASPASDYQYKPNGFTVTLEKLDT